MLAIAGDKQCPSPTFRHSFTVSILPNTINSRQPGNPNYALFFVMVTNDLPLDVSLNETLRKLFIPSVDTTRKAANQRTFLIIQTQFNLKVRIMATQFDLDRFPFNHKRL